MTTNKYYRRYQAQKTRLVDKESPRFSVCESESEATYRAINLHYDPTIADRLRWQPVGKRIISISVSQRDIDGALRPSKYNQSCFPLQRALERAFPACAINVWPGVACIGTAHIDLPPEAAEKNRRWDNGREVEPYEFELNLSTVYMNPVLRQSGVLEAQAPGYFKARQT